MDDDRSLYDRILFGMSHVVWVPLAVALAVWVLR